MLKDAIIKLLGKENSSSFKASLNKSILTGNKKERDYLLGISPTDLCSKFSRNSPEAFTILTEVLLEFKNTDDMFKSPFILNNICSISICMARIRNKKASGFALYLGMLARMGGLNENSIRLIPYLCHPRTLQKYDHILAKHSTQPLQIKLEEEASFQHKLERIIDKMKDLPIGSSEDISILQEKLKDENIETPKMLTTA